LTLLVTKDLTIFRRVFISKINVSIPWCNNNYESEVEAIVAACQFILEI
jgi:hypothetical protein